MEGNSWTMGIETEEEYVTFAPYLDWWPLENNRYWKKSETIQSLGNNDEPTWYRDFFNLVWFYGISSIVGYLMPKPFWYIQTLLFQTILFSISKQFECKKQFYFKQYRLALVHSLVLFNP